MRSTLAAEGTDRAVDQCMKEMREVVRTDDMDAGLAALLPRLEKAVLDSEQRRETRSQPDQRRADRSGHAAANIAAAPGSDRAPQELRQTTGQRGSARRARCRCCSSELSGLQGKALSQLETPGGTGPPGLAAAPVRQPRHREDDRRSNDALIAQTADQP